MINNKVSVSRAIQSALDNMGSEDTIDTPVFKEWAVEAEVAIGSKNQFRDKIFVLEVHGCNSEQLPCEVVSVLGILNGDRGTCCGQQFNDMWGSVTDATISNFDATGNFLVMDVGSGGDSCNNMVNTEWNLQGNCIVFNRKLRFSDNKITINTQSFYTDENGFMMINESHIRAIAKYIEWKYACRTIWKPQEFNIGLADRRQMKEDWGRYARLARGEDNKLTPPQERELADAWNNPLSGYPNSLYRYNTVYGAGIW